MTQVRDLTLKEHAFGGSIFSSCLLILTKTLSRRFRCSSMLPLKTMISSRYTSKVCKRSSQKMFCISCWKVAGALRNRNGIRLYSNRRMGVVNSVLWWCSGCTSTWLYGEAKSIVEKYFAAPSASSDSSILGSGYASFFDFELKNL